MVIASIVSETDHTYNKNNETTTTTIPTRPAKKDKALNMSSWFTKNCTLNIKMGSTRKVQRIEFDEFSIARVWEKSIRRKI